ncbi:hypothetical protein, partial [Pseudomonas aeruginosa]|uniref:hypothetical protein n=1 Tax=Pseudomonas aeruginosa TaxID=287 RepID=UPI00396F3374
KQLNTWVSFQSAEQPLLGQFSVSGNMSSIFAYSSDAYLCGVVIVLQGLRNQPQPMSVHSHAVRPPSPCAWRGKEV